MMYKKQPTKISSLFFICVNRVFAAAAAFVIFSFSHVSMYACMYVFMYMCIVVNVLSDHEIFKQF